jgi:ribonuclease HI
MNERPPIIAQPIKILQLNVQRKKHTTIQLLNNYHTDFDVLILQEPAWSFIGTDQVSGRDIEGPVALQGWQTILPVTSMNHTSPRPRTLTYFRPRNDFNVTLRSDLLEDRDIQVLEITQATHPNTLVINVYNDSPKGDLCVLNKLRDVIDTFPDQPTLITGDFNLHHPSWSQDDRAPDQDQLSTSTAEWLANKNFTLLNIRGEITHMARHPGERPSVIDLSFANAEASRLNSFKQWAVVPGLALDSDHSAIKFTLDHGLCEIPVYFPIKYNLKKVDTEDWTKAFDEELTKLDLTLTPLLNNPNLTNEQLDTYADSLSEAIQNTLARTAQERKPSPNAKPWWDKELDDATRATANAREAHQTYQRLSGEFSHELHTNVLQKRNFFKRLCKFKKKAWVNQTLETASTNDIWSFPKWSKGTRNYPTPPISQGDDQPKATTHEEKCEALRKELYQPPPTLNQEFSPDTTNRLDTDLPFIDVTPEEIRDAIFKNNANSAPGHSQITYQVLKWTWANANGQKHITSLMQKCLRNGYHPKSWRKAIAIALPKLNKPDYSNPRAYRLITLLECLAKILERIVAKRLTFLAGKLNLVPPNQFGGRSNCSTDDAILTFVSDVQAAWSTGKVTSALTFDIKGYFDFVNHKRLLCELRRKNLPLEYVKWTASFLTDREAAICIDGNYGAMKPVENGIPQGSPVSPILAAYYSTELLEKFAIPPDGPNSDLALRDRTPSKPSPINILMYVDDGKIYVSSTSLYTNVILLSLAYEEVALWLNNAGLAPDLNKREIMHYSRRRRYDCSPPITLQDVDGSTKTLVPDKVVKWLGVHFDRKLRFQQHVKIAAARGINAVNALKMLANTIRGLSHTLLRRLYLSCVIPKILYACPAWWNNTLIQAKPLDMVQRKALCLICAAFKTTPTAALEIEASIPPIKHQAQLITRRYAVRINRLPQNNAIIQRLPNEWRVNNKPSFPPPIPSPTRSRAAKTTLRKLAIHTSHEHERVDPYATPPWCRSVSLFPNRLLINPCDNNVDTATVRENHLKLIQEYRTDPDIIYIYTDGSKINRGGFTRAGAGAVAFLLGNEIDHAMVGLGGHAEVFDAEMAALAEAASISTLLLNDFPNTTKIAFFTDNAAAVKAIADPKASSAQYFTLRFHNHIRKSLETHPNLSFSVSWCPSHCDIPGNERADTLAKEATTRGCQIPFSTTRSNAKRRSKFATTKIWIREWRNTPKVGRFAIANRIAPSLNPTKHFLSLKQHQEIVEIHI